MQHLTDFQEKWESIKSDPALDVDAKIGASRTLGLETVLRLGDSAHELFNEIGRKNRLALEYVSDAMAYACATGFTVGPTEFRIGFIPFTAMAPDGRKFQAPRTLDLAQILPPLPNGHANVLTADVCITVEEAVSPAICRRLFQCLAASTTSETMYQDLALTEASDSALDRIDVDGMYRAVRLLPFLFNISDTDPQLSLDERRAWQKAAFDRLEAALPAGLWIYPQGPYVYGTALAVAESSGLIEPAITRISQSKPSTGSGQNSATMQIEAFGSQSTEVASHFRLSSANHSWTVLRLAIPFEQAHWRFMAEKIANIAAEKFDIKAEIAPLVQDLELLWSGGPKRVCLVFGKCCAFTEEWPDGLPLRSRKDEKYNMYWNYEFEFVRDNAELLKSVAAALELPPEKLRCYGSLALQGGVWRPHIFVELPEEADGAHSWPPDQSKLDLMAGLLAYMAGRSWCRTLVMGD